MVPSSLPQPILVRVGIPHYFREGKQQTGYGSNRPGSLLSRTVALSRCISSLLNLQRHPLDLVPQLQEENLRPTPPLKRGEQLLRPIEVEINIFTDGTHALTPVLDQFAGQVNIHICQLENPRHIPLACRDYLIQCPERADLTLYSEDDLVYDDEYFFDKQLWFLQNSQSKAVLMPHRYERIPRGRGRRLLPDGPLRPRFIGRFCKPQENYAAGRFHDGQQVRFDRTSNPHSGMFCLGEQQVASLRNQTLPTEGFIGPLETAATLTVLKYFAVLKPSLSQRSFLWVEHAHPSYLGYVQTWPIKDG